MENLIISFNAIMPMFLIMGLGCFIRNRGFMTEDALNRLNRTNFYFFLSAMCFQSAYTGDLSGIGSGSVILFCVIGILIEFFASDRWVGLSDQDPSHHAILMQSCFRSNTMLIGLPLAKALFDDVAIVVIVYAVTIPMYNFFGALAFEKDRGGKLSFTSLVLKNPLVISTLAGLLLNVLRVRLPVFLTSAVNTLSAMAGGLALIILGAIFRFSGAKKHAKSLAAGCLLRLVVLPLLFVTAGVLLGYRGAEVIAVLTIFGCPVPPAMFTMAKEMGGDAEFASEVVVFTTLFSMVTLFFGVFLLKSTHLI